MFKRKNFLIPALGFTLLGLSGCIGQNKLCTPDTFVDFDQQQTSLNQLPLRDYWPTKAWLRAKALTSDGCYLFEDLSTNVRDKVSFVNSLIVVNHGLIVYEEYFNSFRPEDLQPQWSVTKSVTSSLVGIALDRGDIPSLNQTIGEVFPEIFDQPHIIISPEISIQDALMMRSGLKYDSVNFSAVSNNPGDVEDIEEFKVNSHLFGEIISVPQSYAPGRVWQYSSADTQIVSEMFQAIVGTSLSDFADKYLFEPIGIDSYVWYSDSSDVTVGGSGLWLSPVNMARFGFLVLNSGEWDGGQIIPEAWIEVSTQPQGIAVDPITQVGRPVTNYGYHWWLWEPGSFNLPTGAIQAQGYGGQMILILPDIDTVIVATSNSMVSAQTSEKQQRLLVDFLETHIVRVLSANLSSLKYEMADYDIIDK